MNWFKIYDYKNFIERIGIEVNLFHSFVFLINKNIHHSYLIDIDATKKVIHIDSSNMKLLRSSPKHWFLNYLAKILIIRKRCYKEFDIL